MKKTRIEAQITGPFKKSSTKALLEVLSFARQALAKVCSPSATGDDSTKIEELRRENELLKQELSDLEKIMKEKLK